MNSSEFYEFLFSRSSVREFTPEKVSDEEIEFIIKCASTAPSAGNRESWDVVIITDEGIKEDLADAAFGQEHLIAAPIVLAVCANYVRSMSQYGERGILYGIEDASIACTYLMLAAHSAGLQSCWTGAFDDETVCEILDLPQHARPVALLAIGKGRQPQQKTGRMPVSEHIHNDTW